MLNKNSINKLLSKLGFEIHGLGFIEKLRNSDTTKDVWEKQKNLTISKSPIIFDAGANRGETTSKYLKLFPNATIYAFEPFIPSCEIFLSKHGGKDTIQLIQK